MSEKLVTFEINLILLGLMLGCTPISRTGLDAQKGGTVTLALYQEPDTLNPYLAAQRAAGEVHVFVIEGLLGVNEKGEFIPVLAKEVPNITNGGVSEDGLTLTYHLKEGVTWSDGYPFTCDDVKFTWEAVVHPKSNAVATTGYRDIESVTCPDPYTALVKFQTFYAAYLVPFWTVLPRHATGDPMKMPHWEYNRHPIGTGPFKLTEWVSGDYIMLRRNERYRDAASSQSTLESKSSTNPPIGDAASGKPFLDSVIVRFVPNRDVALQLLRTSEVTIVGDLSEEDMASLVKVPQIAISSVPGPRSERLVLNLGDPAIDSRDPTTQRHPIFGDSRVRAALEYAIDKQEIVVKLVGGKTAWGTNELNIGWSCCDTAPSEYKPDFARRLLDEAGWKVGSDGVRVAQGARSAKDGTRLRFKLQGPTGDSLRERVEELLLVYWKAVGIEAYIENAPTASLFGTWSAGGIARHGKFDALIYTTGPAIIDPHSQVEGYFASWNIPQAKNQGAGYNYSRWINPLADAAIQRAGSSLDPDVRHSAYCQVMEQVTRDRPHIYLYSRLYIAAYRDNLQSWKTNPWKNLGWNAADWWLQ